MRLLKFALTSLLLAIVLAGSAMAWTEEDIETDGLHGTLISLGDGARATVLILAGSGPVDRDGNLPGMRNDSLKLLAHGLADKGIASLRIDKRGIGKSRAGLLREEDLRLGTYVDDAVRWLELLRRRQGGGPILLLGHSEGALIAALAAQKTEVAGLILIAGAGEPASQIIARQLMAAGVSPALQEESKRISSSLVRGVPVKIIPAELMALYRPSVQPYLMSWLPLDPVAELSRVTAPVLIVQGTNDLQVMVGDAQRLATARADSKLVVIEGMNHVLKEAPAERAANLQTYSMPDKPLAPELLPAVAAFIDTHAR